MQHDLFSWEVVGRDFVPMEEITADSRFLNRTIRNWLDGMDLQERSHMVDVLFDFLSTGDITTASDVFQFKSLLTYLKTLETDEESRKNISAIFGDLLSAARKARQEMSAKSLSPAPQGK